MCGYLEYVLMFWIDIRIFFFEVDCGDELNIWIIYVIGKVVYFYCYGFVWVCLEEYILCFVFGGVNVI